MWSFTTKEEEDPVILIAEDETVQRQIFADALRRRGHTVLEAPDAETAIEHLRSHPITHVFTDGDMSTPDDGIMVIEVARRLKRPPTIAVVSGSKLTRDHAKPLGLPILPKPFRLDALMAFAESVVN